MIIETDFGDVNLHHPDRATEPTVEYRVRACHNRLSGDGQTVVLVLRGTEGTAWCVVSSDLAYPRVGQTYLHVWWDHVLLNDDGSTLTPRPSICATDWEDTKVDPADVEFIGVRVATQD